MAAASSFPSRCGNAGMHALVALDPSSVTSPRRFWPPIWREQTRFPRVPGTRGIGKVGNPACRQHASTTSNVQVRGSLCLAASRIPEDRVRLPKSPSQATQEPACREKQRETWKQSKERARALARRGFRSHVPDQYAARRLSHPRARPGPPQAWPGLISRLLHEAPGHHGTRVSTITIPAVSFDVSIGERGIG